MAAQRLALRSPRWLVVVLFGYCCMVSAESTPHFRADGMSLNHLSTKVVLIPMDQSARSRITWATCDAVTVQFSGLRSEISPGVVYSVYADSTHSRVLIGQLNFFGTSRLKGAGRGTSFLLDKKRLGLSAEVGYSTPFILRVVGNKIAAKGSNPIFSQVTAWCAAT